MRRPRGPAARRDRVLTLDVSGLRWVAWWSRFEGITLFYPVGPDGQTSAEVDLPSAKWRKSVKLPNACPDLLPMSLTPGEVPKLLKGLPTVSDLLLTPCWEDGTRKEGTSLFVFPSISTVRLMVKVCNPPLKVSVIGRTWDEAWAALEAVLRSGDVPWEQDDQPRATAKRKFK